MGCSRTAARFRAFALVALLGATHGVDAQPTCLFPRAEWVYRHRDSLRAEWLHRKTVEEDYEDSILAALTLFPDLRGVCIRFKSTPIGTTMAARPAVGSLWGSSARRCYRVLINSRPNRRGAPLLADAPFEARVGVIAHELAHIADYHSRSALEILAMGVSYTLCPRYRQRLERGIDRMAIARGAGVGLAAFRRFVEEHPDATPRYHRRKRLHYLSPREILATMADEEAPL